MEELKTFKEQKPHLNLNRVYTLKLYHLGSEQYYIIAAQRCHKSQIGFWLLFYEILFLFVRALNLEEVNFRSGRGDEIVVLSGCSGWGE